MAGGRPWAEASAEVAGGATSASANGSDAVPLALALSLVALAAWGALLVVRRRTRRVVATIGALAATGVLVAAVTGASRAKDDAVAALAGQGTGASAGLTGWYAATMAGAGVALLAFVVAQVRLAGWPEMSARYDAPSSQQQAPDQTDLWRALDEGDDPTV